MSNSFNHWANIANEMLPACEEAVSNTAKSGKSRFQEQIKTNGQIDTGYMLNSVYASTPQGSDYQSGAQSLPEEKPSKNTEAIIGVAANYGLYQDMGTVYMAGKPIAAPAMDRTREDFDKAMGDLAKRLEEAGK